jgi:peptide/nickel transport system permease protein
VPLWRQYFSWLENVLQGNWGYSNLPGVAGLTTTVSAFGERFPYTAQLAIFGGILTLLIGFPLGIISATHNNRLPDHISRVGAIVGYSIPSFWFGFILQILAVLYLAVHGNPLLPSNGALATQCAICFANPGQIGTFTGLPLLDAAISGNVPYFWDSFAALILPSLTLSVGTVAFLSRILRSSMIEVLNQDFILLARSKGLYERTVIYRHALKNAMLPAITVSGLIFAYLFSGVVVVEYVFAYPGVGLAALTASLTLDVNFLELYALVVALIIVLTNLTVDVLYAVIDPRIRY